MELLDGAQSSDYRKENSASPQGYNCLMAIIPITTFPYYCYKRLWFKRRQQGGVQEKKYAASFQWKMLKLQIWNPRL